MTTTVWLWLGFGAMAAGAGVLLILGWSRRTREEEHHYFIHLFVCLTAMVSYLVMATGRGSIPLADGGAFYIARYFDWVITTPLLLLGLALTAIGSYVRRWNLIAGVMLTDAFMIVSGVCAGLSPMGSYEKWFWFLISSGAFAVIYIAIWGPLRAEASKTGPDSERMFKTDASILSAAWLFYPIVFLLGSEGIRRIDPVSTVAAYTILDVIAKVIYGIYSFRETQAKATNDLATQKVPSENRAIAA